MTPTNAPSRPAEPADFADRVALVLGASRGIGAATSRMFARAGAHVVVASRDAPALRSLADSIRHEGGQATPVRVDLDDPASVVELGLEIDRTFGRLDCAFNNAGDGYLPTPLAEVPPDAFDRVQRVTVRGTFLALREEVPRILRSGGGAIVNMSSTAGMSGFAGGGPYMAAKHAVIGLTKSAALDYAAHNLRVNAVAPGPIDTERLAALPPDAREQVARAVPSRRIGRAEEVGAAVLWLCSPRSSFVTGATLLVDGGRLAGVV